jgi:hypothetical protein
MESSSSGNDETVSSTASSRMATLVEEEHAYFESYAELRSENDRLVKLLSEQKAMLLMLIEHATIDEGWRPFVQALVETKM